MYEEIAADFLNTDIDVFIGGGRDHFAKRKDGLNLTDSLSARGYQVVFDLDGLNSIKEGKVAGLLNDEAMPPYSKGRGEMLAPAALKAIELLNQNEAGFFLMIEGSQIDWGGHANNPEYMVSELLDFNKVIGSVLDFAEKDGNTLVVITADHETGGLTLPHGSDILGDTTATHFSTTHHTAVMVPVFAKGPGEDAFGGIGLILLPMMIAGGIYENTEFFNKFMFALGLAKEE